MGIGKNQDNFDIIIERDIYPKRGGKVKLTIISNKKAIIESIRSCFKNLPKRYRELFELNAYNTVSLQEEAIILKMYEDIEYADICILDINNDTEYPLLFNIVYNCISCKGYIIPSNFKSDIGSFLRLGMLTIKDITGINPKIDIDSNYLSMVKTAQNIEAHGNTLLGKLKDFRNYSDICKYIKAGDPESMNRLLTLLAEEYCGSFSNINTGMEGSPRQIT